MSLYSPQESEEFDRIAAMPIFLKAQEIVDLARSLVVVLPENDEISVEYQRLLLEDAFMLPPKIGMAETSEDYVLKMENATMVKVSARNLLTHIASLKYLGIGPKRYLSLMNDEIENFRALFVDWVATFIPSEVHDDGWGLFV